MEAHLVLADDWELRGDGSGDVKILQVDPMRQLREIYEQHGIRGTFNCETLQQLNFRKFGASEHELTEKADMWDEAVKEAYKAGHDIQLHIHSQWIDAVRSDSKWKLGENWSITDTPADRAAQAISDGICYLRELINPIDENYKVVSFRSGAWKIAPSENILRILMENSIVFDMSIARGLFYDLPQIKLDYTEIDEPLKPYYPQMNDARRVSKHIEPIICIPTFTYKSSFFNKFVHKVARKIPSLKKDFFAPSEYKIADDRTDSDYAKNTWITPKSFSERILSFLKSQYQVADLAQCSFSQMSKMFDQLLRHAEKAGGTTVFVLENHTKDIGNFEPFDRFCKLLNRHPGVKVKTSQAVAENLKRGNYSIRKGDEFSHAYRNQSYS